MTARLPRSRPRSPDLCRDMAAQGGIHRLEEHLGASKQAGSARKYAKQRPLRPVPGSQGQPRSRPRRSCGTLCGGGEQDPGVVTLLTEGGSTVPCAGEVIREDGDTPPARRCEMSYPIFPCSRPALVTGSILVHIKSRTNDSFARAVSKIHACDARLFHL